MLPLGRFSRFGTGALAKPLQMCSFISLTIAVIFLSLIISGCTSSTPGVRKFYLVSLKYNSTALTKASDAISAIGDDISNVVKGGKGNDTKEDTFTELRISYRGLCLDTSNDTFICGSNAKALGDVKDDPLSLIRVGDTYKDKVSFTVPLWAALAFFLLSWLMVAPNTIPCIPIPAITRKIAGVATPIGALIMLGAMLLQQVTTGAVATLVKELGLGAVDAHVGHANEVFGWACFGLTALAALCCMIVAGAEWAVEKAQQRAEALMARGVAAGLDKASGGRMGMDDLEALKGGYDSARSFRNGGFRNGNVNDLKKPAAVAAGFASKVFHRK